MILFFQCLYSSIGATVKDMDRVKYDTFVKKAMTTIAIEDTFVKPATAVQCPSSKETMYDYFFDKSKRVWMAWEWIVPDYIHNRNLQMSEILVPTVDTLRTESILTLMNSVSPYFL